jgi:purine nucleosidase
VKGVTIWDLNYERRLRAIIDSDAKNEADDQFALVHALLSPSLDIRGLVAAHFGTRHESSMRASRDEIDLLTRLLDMESQVNVADGAPAALPDVHTYVDSPGARLIIEESMRKDTVPLFAAFLGPLTDMASALLIEPRIADRDLTVVWIGGGPYELGGAGYWPEFNLSNDVNAANVVFSSALKVWQVPMSTYLMMSIGYAELYEQVVPNGEVGSYLARQLVEYNQRGSQRGRSVEFRCLGDSPAVGLLINPNAGSWTARPAPGFNADGSYDYSKSYRPIRVYTSIDARFILSDLFAKLRSFTGRNRD